MRRTSSSVQGLTVSATPTLLDDRPADMASLLRQIVAAPRARHDETGLDLCYVTSDLLVTYVSCLLSSALSAFCS